jgi:hypothetical protein
MVLEVLFTSMRTSEIREIINYDMSNLLGKQLVLLTLPLENFIS